MPVAAPFLAAVFAAVPFPAVPFLAAAFAAVLLSAAPAHAARSPAQDYVRARAADADDQGVVAVQGYAAALAIAPDDPVLATRTYRQAIGIGDGRLALQAARVLDHQGLAPPDARLLMMSDAVIARDWTRAGAAIDAIEREQSFAFLVPTLRAWVAFGARRGDAIAQLATAPKDALARPYAAEHRALLLLATGHHDEGVAAIRAIGTAAGGRQIRLRIAAAALLARKGQHDAALALLDGDGRELAVARDRVRARKALPGAIDDPARGIAELLVRVAIDINRERVTPIALALARMATLLAPDNAETWLVTSELLAAAQRYASAQEALGHVDPADPFADHAREARVAILIRADDKPAALAAAEAVVAQAGAGATAAQWMRVGDTRAALDRQREAADAYATAVARADPATLPAALLLQGGALEEAGDWQAARAVLERARALAPDQPLILNLLGYAQLERRENMAAAQALIEQAHRLRPDDPSITDSLGWAYYLRGDVARAIPTLETAATGDPGESAINEHLGDAYWAAGRRYEARYAWRAAMVTAQGPAATRIRGKIDRGWTLASAAP